MKCFCISILCFTVFSYFVSNCKALDVYHFIDSEACAMGGCLSALPGFANPAGYVFDDASGRVVSLQYANRYGVKELSTYAGMFNFPNKYLNAGIYVSRYGFRSYNETLASINAYRSLSSWMGLGVRVSYLHLHHSESASDRSLVTADIGIRLKPTERLVLSVLAVNPFCIEMKADGQKMEVPVILSVGGNYLFSDTFSTVVEVEKDFAYPVVCRCGMEYVPIEELSIRAGMYGKPFTPTFGLGLKLASFSIDLAFDRHPVLGFRSFCGLSFNY